MDFNYYRVRNIVMHKLQERPIVLTLLEKGNLSVEGVYIDSGTKADFYKSMMRPVPITPLRLEKFHFTKVDKCWVYNNCWVRMLDTSCVVEFGGTRDTIQFIHELQNLYLKEKKEELHLPFLKIRRNP